ncbi:MAG: hypothetical protein CVT67_00210 [Actinobacteria bacterium HGW-Actinobacteria-7]|jgi:hypothetical protein|nr:MAG: hypothetical protein CVT67_00210 [Actinobacteria bacterium HGW-Actinobacteria-7]
MDYGRLEKFILIIGGATVAVSTGTALASGSPETVEIIAQLLLFVVLFAAVKYGRRGGLVAAISASTVYVLLRLELVADGTLSTTALYLLSSRLLAFGLIGIAGGEICGHIRYSLASVEGRSALDEWSRVFNERWAYKTLDQARGRFRRYGEPFSIVILTMSPSVMTGVRPARQRALTRLVADTIRSDIRMVDEVARLNDGRFVVIMPHTPVDGGNVVCVRLAGIVRKTIGARDEAVTVECIGMPGAEPTVDALIDSLAPEDRIAQVELAG